ncbi:MAG: hypothetical protein RMN25_02355 [Anaerolineae bacterium]|nr:hypothetical protein [Thermoflexales bacterium]MDW8406598.1 hypothetical protein [Anaerolineae bacterium]
MVKYASATVSGVITAPAQKLFAIVSDVTRHPELAGSGEVMRVEWVTPPPIRVGSEFRARQQIGLARYSTRSFVQVYEPPYRFTWLSGPGFRKPPFGQLWGFEFQPQGDHPSTLVLHSMTVPVPLLNVPPLSWIADAGARHETRNMLPTLENLARMAQARLIGDIRIVLSPSQSHRALLPIPT